MKATFVRRLRPGCPALALPLLALLVLPAPARADDFPNDVKRTFTTDIPHFFQDDIPCAFGGKPTSGTKSSCKGPSHPAARHKAAAPKKAHKAVKPPAESMPRPDPASAGAAAGAAGSNSGAK
ncbi:MAG TPA: hypothetical protein VG328_15665 [Stellaceae bacterium]|jgi:hypothetical protein|nr:hypothetical protein [Stellaceae bacterium]